MAAVPSSSLSVNGHAHPNGTTSHNDGPSTDNYDQSPSTPSASEYLVNGFTESEYERSHNEEVVNHLYQAGFQMGNYADTLLHVEQNVYRLHAIILSRSPFLAHLMSTSPQTTGQRVIYVHINREPEVTQEGFAIALGHLYSPVSMKLIRPDNARAVLASGWLLGGMDDLCQVAYNACTRSISVDTIGSWLEFIDTIPHSGDGVTTPNLPPSSVGPYGEKLRSDVFHFLVVSLPELLDVQNTPQDSSSGGGRNILLQVFSRVPFEMFKAAVESPIFRIGSDQARFQFAKDAIQLRKSGIARGVGAEETVVLAFGGSNFGGSAVHVTRKMKKRQLWKVNS